jgi:multicomponent Na+:H+ antiporter subunit D
MGAVMYRTGKINCTDLGGLYKSMPLTCIFCIIGAASISGFPLFSGFISKSMVMEASALGGMNIIWFLLIFSSVGVLEHAGIKVPYYAFFSHDSGIRTKEAPLNMLLAMGIAAFLCVFIGVFPGYLYSLLPYSVGFDPYTPSHVISVSQLLFFGALAYILLVLSGIFPAEIRAINLDADWFYRKTGAAFLRFCNVPLNSSRLKVKDSLTKSVASITKLSRNPLLIPGLAIRYGHLRIVQAFGSLSPSTVTTERLTQLEIRLKHFQETNSWVYDENIHRGPIGIGILLATLLLFLYVLIYMVMV